MVEGSRGVIGCSATTDAVVAPGRHRPAYPTGSSDAARRTTSAPPSATPLSPPQVSTSLARPPRPAIWRSAPALTRHQLLHPTIAAGRRLAYRAACARTPCLHPDGWNHLLCPAEKVRQILMLCQQIGLQITFARPPGGPPGGGRPLTPASGARRPPSSANRSPETLGFSGNHAIRRLASLP